MNVLAGPSIVVGAIPSHVCLERQEANPPCNYEARETVTRPRGIGESQPDGDAKDDERKDERCSHGARPSAADNLVNESFA